MQNDVLGERLQVEFLSELGNCNCTVFNVFNISIEDPLGTMRNCKVKFDDDIIPSKV